jgi:hypothetical protein
MSWQLQLPQIDPGMVQMLVLIMNGTFPVHLSAGVSINLSRVLRYGPIELTEEREVGKGPSKTVEEVPTGEYRPGLIFEGGDFLLLSDEENEVFRPIWDAYAELGSYVITAATAFASVLRQADAAIAAEGAA